VACRVRYLNSSGIMRREIKGIEALANALPADWLLYVALNCYPKGQDPMEIDALVVMDDRVLLLELKDWNGQLTHQNDRWFIGGQSRGRSAVILANEKAKKLKTVLCGEIPLIKNNLYVDSRVVLTATATRDQLHVNEKPFVWTLMEACSISNPSKKATLLKPGKISLIKLYQFEKDFDRVTGNTKIFQPLEADWSGYKVVEENVFVHPRGVWQDHRAENKIESRLKAMVRTWSFDKLPPGLNSPDRRRLIAHRETKAFAHLSAIGSELVDRNLLREICSPSEDILTHHFEVRAIAQGMLTLDRYLEKARDDLSDGDRLLIATRLINLVAQLHRCSVAHRDIGPRSVWIGGPTSIAMTGLMSCQLPDEESVVDWLTTLRGYAPDLPEDCPPSSPSTGRQRDVYLTAYLVAFVLTGNRPTIGGEGSLASLPVEFNYLEGWLRRALSINPSHRFEDVASMENEFAELVESAKEPSLDQSLLDRFGTTLIPYQRWVTNKPLASTDRCTVYSTAGEDGAEYTVKVWNGLMRGMSTASDLALIRLLDSASRVKAVPVAGLPNFIELGLSPIGPYVVYRYQTGVSLRELDLLATSEVLSICLQLISAITALHDLGCDHGDISYGNTIYDRSSAKLCLLDPFDISPVGDGIVRTPALCPDNWERLSQQSLDRYAVLRIAHDLLANHQTEALAEVKSLLDAELKRPIIETLEVATSSLQKALEAANRPPIPCFHLSTKIDSKGFDTGGVTFFLSRRPVQGGLQRYTLTSQKAQLVLQGDEHKLVDQFFIAGRFEKLAYESSTAMPVSLQLSLIPGPEAGFDALYQHLRAFALEPEQTPSGEVIGSQPRFDVARHWQRQMDIETNDRIEIELTEEVASREGVSVYRYVNLGRSFDFDPTDTVDVLYANSNKRIGEVDHSLSDFAGTLGIRNVSRRLSIGDRVFLVDRREQASIDRRAKAIRRIIEKQSAIPDLVEFFYPDTARETIDFGLVISDEELAPYGLNQGQQDAFISLLRYGPVGLLQGPPGTGKTRFIAAFVHWLVTKGGNQRVLIASQSHEAVNNVIDSLLLLYKRQGGQPNLLRIGSKGITERIRPFHTAELRERYRIRFEAAAKFRFTQLTSAKGIGRPFAIAIFDLDQGVGTLARRCADLQQLAFQETDLLAIDREKNMTQLKRVQNSLSAAAKQFLGRVVDTSQPLEEIEVGFQSLLQKHPDSSPADLAAGREILRITHEWLSSLASPQRNFEEFLAKTRSVVTATCVGVGQTRIRIDSQIFDWVIVDEAARCTPGELAVPIQLGRRVLLVGDHLQLKPMISRSVVDQMEEEDPETEREHFIMSDFERAFTSPFGRVAGRHFTEQYRMDPAICDLVSACFYEPHQVSLKTSDLRRSQLQLGSHPPEWLAKPLTWIDTSLEPNANETKVKEHKTFFNDAEVHAVIHLLESLSRDQDMISQLAEGDEETPIGVICMYSAQKSKIDMAWARHSWEPRFRRLVRIDTVDSYQGKENTIVILSLVRNNSWQDIGHVGSANRCNVAVSRAKERLIVVGAKRMWESVSDKSPMRRVLTFIANRPETASIVDAGALR